MTDRQLDSVTAGGVEVVVATDAAGVGAFTLGGTSSNAVVVGGATRQQPDLTSGAGLADGSAIAVGSNFGLSGPPAGTATNVQTAGAADGNQVINATVNNTMTAGGVTMQAGWTFVFGLWTRL